jgi:hypothetical protein
MSCAITTFLIVVAAARAGIHGRLELDECRAGAG